MSRPLSYLLGLVRPAETAKCLGVAFERFAKVRMLRPCVRLHLSNCLPCVESLEHWTPGRKSTKFHGVRPAVCRRRSRDIL
jgi:hypothetical protein